MDANNNECYVEGLIGSLSKQTQTNKHDDTVQDRGVIKCYADMRASSKDIGIKLAQITVDGNQGMISGKSNIRRVPLLTEDTVP